MALSVKGHPEEIKSPIEYDPLFEYNVIVGVSKQRPGEEEPL